MSNYTLKQFYSDGLSKNLPDHLFDADQLKKGTKVEYEHTSNHELAKKIAKDHLVEFPDYYNRLEKMEKKAKKYWTKERYRKTHIGKIIGKDHEKPLQIVQPILCSNCPMTCSVASLK